MSNEVADVYVGTSEWNAICATLRYLLLAQEASLQKATRHGDLSEIRYRAGVADGVRQALVDIGYVSKDSYA